MKLLYALLIGLLTAGTAEAQTRWFEEPTPLHLFFQKHFDSTFIYHHFSSWAPYPNYHIVARHKGATFLFTYKDPYGNLHGRNTPSSLAMFMIRSSMAFQDIKPDTNRYLLPFTPATTAVQGGSWNQLSQLGIWQLQPEKKFTAECAVDDGGEHVFYRITKEGIETLYFYEPDFFETCAPPDINRTHAVQLIAYCRSLFRS